MQKHRVLIVEDEQDIAGLIKHTLERTGSADAEVVGSGDAALRAVTARPPDLIILDLNLPALDGFEVCRLLRQRSDARHLPIIMLTARTSESDRVAGLELGADDYVTKPFSLRELTARVKAVLRRATAPEERQAARYQGAHLVADFDAVSVAVDGTPVGSRAASSICFAIWCRTGIGSFHGTRCSSGCGDTTGWSKPDRSTCTWDACVRSSESPDTQIETAVGLGYRFVENGV